jgi:hypothetical protein
VEQLNVGPNANAVAQNASISIGDTYGKIQVSNYNEFTRPSIVLENKFSTTKSITINGPSNSTESMNIAFQNPTATILSATRTQLTIPATTTQVNYLTSTKIQQPDYDFSQPNEMTNITMYADSVLTQSGKGTIRQSGTQENYLKDTNIPVIKAEKAILGTETDEFINKDGTLRLYLPFDSTLGSANRFNNFNRYFVDGTYPASSMSNTGTLTNNFYVGNVGDSCFEYTNGRYFFNYLYTSNPSQHYNTNYMSFGGWVKAVSSATSCRLFFVQTNGTGDYAVLDVDVGGSMYFACDEIYFKSVSVQATGTNGAWIHVFVVIEGTTQKVYRNGTLISTLTRTQYATNNEATFGMGRISLMGSSSVDDLRLYSRSLTGDEVAALFRYRGSLTEPFQTKMHGITMLGDRLDRNAPTRGFNVRSQDGIISIGRYSGSQPGFELLNLNPDTGAVRSTALFLGGGSTDYGTFLLRTGGDVFVYFAYRDEFDLRVRLRVRGNARVDGAITQQTSTSTNEMRAITLYADQNLTQSGTGIISQTGTGTNALKNTSITGTLAITGYSDVKATLDTFSAVPAAITGITYNSGTDTTTIDNNVDITKNLILQDDKVVLTSPTGYVMDECEKHTYLYSINRGIGTPYRTIRTTTFEAVDINADFAVGSFDYVFSLVKIIKGITYTGAFFINSSVGTTATAQMALMNAGVGKVGTPLERFAVTNTFSTSLSSLVYAPFRTAYTATETKYAYVGFIVTAIALNPVLRGQSLNYNNRYGITTCQTGSLTSLCCGYEGASNSSFDTMGTSLNPSQAMTAYGTQMYCGLYSE